MRRTGVQTWRRSQKRTATFGLYEKTLFDAYNMFLEEVKCTSINYDLHVYFSKGGWTEKLNSIFNETVVMGMLETKDYDKIDMVLPFMRVIVVRLCDPDHLPIVLSYARYVEVIHAVHRYGRRSGWTREEVEELCKTIKQFKEQCLREFAQYETSELQTS